MNKPDDKKPIHYWTNAMGGVSHIASIGPVATDDSVLCGMEDAGAHIEEAEWGNFTFDRDKVTCPDCRYLLDNIDKSWKWSRNERMEQVCIHRRLSKKDRGHKA